MRTRTLVLRGLVVLLAHERGRGARRGDGGRGARGRALLVGDSVRGSLRDLVLQRLGRADRVVSSAGFFREGLADDARVGPDTRRGLSRDRRRRRGDQSGRAGAARPASRSTALTIASGASTGSARQDRADATALISRGAGCRDRRGRRRVGARPARAAIRDSDRVAPRPEGPGRPHHPDHRARGGRRRGDGRVFAAARSRARSAPSSCR